MKKIICIIIFSILLIKTTMGQFDYESDFDATMYYQMQQLNNAFNKSIAEMDAIVYEYQYKLNISHSYYSYDAKTLRCYVLATRGVPFSSVVAYIENKNKTKSMVLNVNNYTNGFDLTAGNGWTLDYRDLITIIIDGKNTYTINVGASDNMTYNDWINYKNMLFLIAEQQKNQQNTVINLGTLNNQQATPSYNTTPYIMPNNLYNTGTSSSGSNSSTKQALIEDVEGNLKRAKEQYEEMEPGPMKIMQYSNIQDCERQLRRLRGY